MIEDFSLPRRDRKKRFFMFRDLGIPGPPPSFLTGNLHEITEKVSAGISPQILMTPNVPIARFLLNRRVHRKIRIRVVLLSFLVGYLGSSCSWQIWEHK